MAKNLIDYWFVVDPSTDKVVQIAMLGPLGMLLRKNETWEYVAGTDSGLDENSKDKIYQYDWASDTTPLPDDFTEDDLTLDAVRKFDAGELTVTDLDGIANLIYDGTDEE